MAEGAPAERLSAPASAVEPTRLDTARELRNPVPRPQPSHERQPPSAPDETGELIAIPLVLLLRKPAAPAAMDHSAVME
jgi:hypothetical protein